MALSLLGVLILALGFVVIGGALGGRQRLREADLLVGWAAVSALMIAGGRLTALPLDALAGVAALAVAVSAFVLWRRREAPLPRQSLWLLAALIPFLAVTASMQPSQWDEFTQWLPNTRYLVLFDAFPSAGGVPSDSVLPAYPPAIPLVPYLSGLLTGTFAEGVLPWFNLLLLACLGRLAVRLFRQDESLPPTAAAWGLLAVTLLGTTFVPKLVLSAYADTATAVSLAFAAFLGMRLIGGEPAGRRAAAIQFAAAFALLPMTKQGNFALMGLLVLALAVEGWRAGNLGRLPRLALLLLPAAAITLAWRAGVVAGVGELSVRPLDTWRWDLMPAMLESMVSVALSKGGYFGTALALLALAAWKLRDPRWSLVRVFVLVFLGYNLFLAFVYLTIMTPYEAANAASFWRYNTHLGALQTLIIAFVAGLAWRRAAAGRAGLTRTLAVLGAVVVAVAPLAAIKNLRFDRQPVKVHVRDVAAEIAGLLPPGATLTVVDPRGTGFYGIYLDYLLGFGKQVDASLHAFNPGDATQWAVPGDGRRLWVHTQMPDTAAALGLDLPTNASHLIEARNGKWQVVRSWPFPGYDDPAAVKD